jgi:preprotein translocase subunit SecE
VNTRVEPNRPASAADIAKYIVALALVAAGVAGFYYFEQWATGLRALLVLAGLVAGVAVFMTTVKGAQTREFLSESRFELRKVVWPTRQEALRTTWVVMIAVVVVSLILAGFDVVIRAAVKFLLGQ